MKDNRELVRAGFDAWNRDDLDAWLGLVHPDVEFLTSGVFPDLDDVYRGHAGMSRFWRAMHDPWEELRINPERVADHGDRLAVLFRFRAKGAGSGAAVDLRFGNAYRLRNGLIVEMVARRTFEEALEVVGLTEKDVAGKR